MENLLVIGFLLHLAVIGVFAFRVFIRQNVLMRATVPRVFSAVLVFLFLVGVGALFILLYQNEDLCAIYGIPLLVIEAFIIIGFLFVAEALSVMIQVAYFKRTGGKRIFRMTPIHHHFELGGWSENKVVAVFTGATVVLCIIGYLGL